MTDESDHSVTAWISGLKAGNQQAAQDLWDRYLPRLLTLAKRHLGKKFRRVMDEEDVAISVFDSLCRGAENGNFKKFDDRDDLWRLLVAICKQKSIDDIRWQNRQKRGGGDVRGESVFLHLDQPGMDGIVGQDQSVRFLASVDEEFHRLLALLEDDTLQSIAKLRMEGHGNDEIAQLRDVSLSTVERKLRLIRTRWAREVGL